ncbi:kinase-like domain-containing protein [Gymnopilus junonius]|uniref:Kinase-like domain-containing protein n=1 Tax=Gymnopilus junonius TaxID=109634 RepID=A0A9P5NVR9_GYMJU|nr:kinase-like domain-containing protein [Gymnopilus junonius]
MERRTPTVPSTFQLDQDDFSIQERLKFWDAPDTIRFFEEHGYILYKRIFSYGDPSSASTPVLSSGDFMEDNYPYASYDHKSDPDKKLLATDSRGKVAFAQDSVGRHVAIKLVRDDSDEYRILRFLNQQSLEILRENCVIPVLELLPIEGFWFAVMPRWGESARHPDPVTILGALEFMHSMLKGLTFLHKHNISHGDINDENVLVNHFCDARNATNCQIRRDLCSKQRLSYALFDFDFSVILPADSDRREYRLPYKRSWGSCCRVYDTAQGEFDYNPFVFDVGNMGAVFCYIYQHLAPAAPFLAPLLDRMTTRDLERRFTAMEALQFFEDMFSKMTETQLGTPFWEDDLEVYVPYDKYNRWINLPPDFARTWAVYREPPIPLKTWFLRWLCRREWVYHTVAFIRWFTYRLRLVLLPRRLTTSQFVGLRSSSSIHFVPKRFLLL